MWSCRVTNERSRLVLLDVLLILTLGAKGELRKSPKEENYFKTLFTELLNQKISKDYGGGYDISSNEINDSVFLYFENLIASLDP